jgi:hypothetical protein
MPTVNKVTHYNNPKIVAEVSENLGEAMVGLTMYGCSFTSFSGARLTSNSDKDLKGGRMAERGN